MQQLDPKLVLPRVHREDRELDQRARQQISHELGHNRIDVVSAYIGGRR